ncbi:MAG: hypothetical protein K2X82_08290 [Gemmataceae bacterium]|nr:hypothetical protein [Gemmataceae bacterium]
MAAARKKPKSADPFDVVRRLRYLTDEVNLGFSCGKDSAAIAELCGQWFRRVHLFYMYVVPGLSFHEQYMRWWESRLGDKLGGREVIRMPHWYLGKLLGTATYRDYGLAGQRTGELKIRDIEVEVCRRTLCPWFAYGMKKVDSLERRGMLSKCSGIELSGNRAYPLADWSQRGVSAYLRHQKVPLSPEYNYLPSSMSGAFTLDGRGLQVLRDHFPADFRRVLERFPYAEANLFRYETGMTEESKRVYGERRAGGTPDGGPPVEKPA